MLKKQIKYYKNKITTWLSYVQLIPILSKIKPGDIVVDCGANVGDVTGYFASKRAQVYSFEPDPNAFGVLCKRFEKTYNVKCLKKGVWKENAKMKLFQHAETSVEGVPWTVSSSIVQEKRNVNQDKYVEVELIDLSEFLRELNQPIKVLKIDIEGAEIEVLNKLIDDGIYKNVIYILVETHEKKIPEQEKELRLLKNKIHTLGIKNINLNWL